MQKTRNRKYKIFKNVQIISISSKYIIVKLYDETIIHVPMRYIGNKQIITEYTLILLVDKRYLSEMIY